LCSLKVEILNVWWWGWWNPQTPWVFTEIVFILFLWAITWGQSTLIKRLNSDSTSSLSLFQASIKEWFQSTHPAFHEWDYQTNPWIETPMTFIQYMVLINNKLQVQMQSWATEKLLHTVNNMKVYLLDCLFLWSIEWFWVCRHCRMTWFIRSFQLQDYSSR
jgi:hypothetical protein